MTVLDHVGEHRAHAVRRADKAAHRIVAHIARGGAYSDAILARARAELAAAVADIAAIDWVARVLDDEGDGA